MYQELMYICSLFYLFFYFLLLCMNENPFLLFNPIILIFACANICDIILDVQINSIILITDIKIFY